MTKPGGIYYPEYLQLDKLLNAQQLESDRLGNPAHDELLFIVVHQAYELWFKLILFELKSVIDMFNDDIVDERQIGRIVALLERIHAIQRLMIGKLEVLETMTPLDFLEFRDLLVPASGFQSVQFKELEIRLGIKRDQRIPTDREFFYSRLSDEHREYLYKIEALPSLFEVTQTWLERFPFLNFEGFDFWHEYERSVEQMLERDRNIIESNSTLPPNVLEHQLAELDATRMRFNALFDQSKFDELRAAGEFRFSHRGMLVAIFINLYRDEPLLQLPFRYLSALVELDQNLTTWRSRHALMVHRMLGSKIGTGGSSGHDYLRRTTDQNRAFKDLFNLSTFLIRRSEIPKLPNHIQNSMGFRF
ncbi:MAG TPA: tryptophan 2,3-dioxygenase family protein [Pirellulaceae bacterium]|nr:tryptophan 2,3-dioxygenase family protein [Pirellulaceae bacterium]HMO91787.1 tryptophan 2,3-dioxygenase family protein [Pirellulaceae bacterium]HMP69586.1 tryptophan 2,3-dioxygenase family protein [Pirellulaceae bacterium]